MYMNKKSPELLYKYKTIILALSTTTDDLVYVCFLKSRWPDFIIKKLDVTGDVCSLCDKVPCKRKIYCCMIL